MARTNDVQKSSRGKWRIAAVAVAAALLLSGCGGGIGGGGGGTASGPVTKKKGGPGVFAKDSTMTTIQQRGKLLVGMVTTAQPFSYQDPNLGTWAGFDTELVKEIATGIFGTNIENRIEWIPVDPRDRERALEQNRVDMALGRYEISVARKRFVDFAGPYYETRQDAITLRASRLGDAASLNGKKICVVTGSTNVDAIKENLPSADVSTVMKTVAECNAALSSGTVSAIIADHVDSLDVEKSASKLTVVTLRFGSYPYGVGIHKGTTDLRQYVNDIIEGWRQWSTELSRTTGETGATKPPVDRY